MARGSAMAPGCSKMQAKPDRGPLLEKFRVTLAQYAQDFYCKHPLDYHMSNSMVKESGYWGYTIDSFAKSEMRTFTARRNSLASTVATLC